MKYFAGHEYHLACIGNGYPLENVTWYWKPCLFRESCQYVQIFGPADNNVRLGYDTFIRKTYQVRFVTVIFGQHHHI